MADEGPTISVFVVSLDEDILPFAEFCRHSACDLVESKNPVIMFGLHSIDRRNPPSDVSMVFGRWPRFFKTLPSLRDNLMDAVTSRLASGHLVSIILVARSPDNISADEVLKPILEDIAQKRSHNSKLWSVGFFNCGPAHGLGAASALVAGAGAPLRNVFFGSDSAQSEGVELRHKDHANLRFLIDLARSDGQSKKLFAESTTKIYPKIIWFRDHEIDGEIYPEQLLQKLARFFARMAGQGIKENAPKNIRFEAEISKFLDFIKPTLEDETPDRLASVASKISQKIPDSTGLQDSSNKNISTCNTEIRNVFQTTYQESSNNVRQQLKKADARIIKVEEARSFTLPGGGYTQQDKSRIDEGKKRFIQSGSDWTNKALQSRLLALGQHSDFQNRPDPSRKGSFAFDALDEGAEFGKCINAAHKSADDLPNNRWVWWLLPLVPVLLVLFTGLAHIVSNEFAVFDHSKMFELLLGNPVLALLITGLAAIPVISALAWRWEFIRTAEKKITELRIAADDIAKRLLETAGNTSSYLAHTRSALLAAEGARRISQRVKEEPFSKLQEQTKNLLPNANIDLVDLQAEQVDNKFIEQNPPDTWMSDQIKVWRKGNSDDDSQWAMESSKSMPITGVKLDGDALPNNIEPIASTYSSGRSRITMAALQVVTASKTVEDT